MRHSCFGTIVLKQSEHLKRLVNADRMVLEAVVLAQLRDAADMHSSHGVADLSAV